MQVETITSAAPASVNAFVLDVPDGAVVVDSLRTNSAAGEVVNALERRARPVVAVLLTHPHPDHFGGLTRVAKAFPDARLLATEGASTAIREDSDGLIALSRQAIGEDFPQDPVVPEGSLATGTTISLGGLELRVDALGAGESREATAFYSTTHGVLFGGDLVQHNMHPFVVEGRLEAWLEQLRATAESYPADTVLYPGHGRPGRLAELVDAQLTYLEELRDLVAEHLDSSTDSDDLTAAMAAQLRRRYPSWDSAAALPDLVERNIAAVRRELAG